MLRQQTIHLKNIIFFKITICMLCVAFFLWRIPAAKLELQESTKSLDIAYLQLSDTESKVKFIKDSQDIINQTYRTYSESLKIPPNLSCLTRSKFEEKFTDLGAQFRLKDSPTMLVSQTPHVVKFNGNHTVQVVSNNIKLFFDSQGFKHALAFIKETYKLLPIYSQVSSLHIEKKDAITPSNINQLTTNNTPQLIESILQIQTREVRVEAN